MRLVLVAGEASGDLLGADLIHGLRSHFPQLSVSGIGGPAMQEAGMDCWYASDELAIMGFAEVLAHLPKLLRIRRRVTQRLLAEPPDCFIGIDAPDFNLGLERRLRQAGIRTVQYVSPSIWAWRRGRAKTIGRSVDLMLTLFPFEPPIYRRYQVTARFVGHPGARRLPLEPDRAAAREQLQLAECTPLVALLPGSRIGELKRLGGRFAEAAAMLVESFPQIGFVAPAARGHTRDAFARQLEQHGVLDRCRMLDGKAALALTAADVAMVASGTATLEALLCKTPMVVSYRISPLTYFLVHALGMMKVSRFSLPNALDGGALVPELMQSDASSQKLALAVTELLRDPATCKKMRTRFTAIHRQLFGDINAADAISEWLTPND